MDTWYEAKNSPSSIYLYVGMENHVKCGYQCSSDTFSPTSMPAKLHVHCFIGIQYR